MADNDQVGAGQSVGRSGETPPSKKGSPESAKLERRRKFLIGGLSTAPVIATLASRPAWAGANCPYSDRLSDNLSEDPVDCLGDEVLEYQQEAVADSGARLSQVFDVGPINPVTGTYDFMTDEERKTMSTGRDHWKAEDFAVYDSACATATRFTDIFYVTPPAPDDPNATMMQCLMSGQLGGECVAAYCNAHFYGADFGYQPSAIVKMVQDAVSTNNLDWLDAVLKYLNANMQGENYFMSGGGVITLRG